jgi:steroid Delta-isomerase
MTVAVTPAKVREVIENYVRAWATGDKELLLSVFAEDAVWNDPVGTPPFIGHAGVGAFWDFAHQGPPRQLIPKVNRIVACANEGILDFTMQVRLPQFNQGLDLRVVDRFVLNEQGRIQTAQAYWDEGSATAPPGMEFFVPNIDEAYKK